MASNLDITSLAISVTSQGVADAAKSLNDLAAAGAAVEKAMPGIVKGTDSLAESNKNSATATEALMAKFQKQADLLGANTSQTNAYVAAKKGLASLEQQMAGMLGAEVDAYKALAKAQSEAVSINNKMNSDAAKQAQDGAAYIAMLKREADQVGLTHKELKELNAERMRSTAAQLGVTQQTEGYINKLKESKGPHESFNLLTAGSARELMVLGHELSQGQLQRFGGSLIVLAERVNFLPSLLEKAAAGASSLGMGLGAFVGIALGAIAVVAAFTYALIKGSAEQHAFNNALTITGNFAGATGDSLNKLAHIATESGGSLRDAKTAILEMANSGKFTSEQILMIARAATDMEHASGKAATATIKDFEELATMAISSTGRSTNVISQHVMKLNDHYHFLTAAQFDQISMLEKSGKAREAASLAEELYASALETRSTKIQKELGYIQTAWKHVQEMAGSAWDAMLNAGKKSSLGDEVERIKGMIITMDNRPKWFSGQDQGGNAQAQFDANRLRLVNELTAAVTKLNNEEGKAVQEGIAQRKNQEQIHAQDRERVIRETYDKHQKATRELAEFDKLWDNATQQYKDENLKGHLLAREALEKATHEKVAKVKGIGLSGLNAAEKEIEAQAEVTKRGYDNELRLIEMNRKYKITSEVDAANQKDAILNKEYAEITAFYEKQIKLASDFHSSDARLNNDAMIKKLTLQEKLGKFQDDMQMKMDMNNSKEIKASMDADKAAQQAYDAQSKTLEKEIDALNDKHRAYMSLPAAIKAAGTTEKQMQDLITQGTIDRLEMSKLEDTLGAVEIARINDIIAKLKQKQAAQKAVEADQAANNAALGMPAALRAEAAAQSEIWKNTGNEIEKALTQAFGNAGAAAGQMFKDFADGQAQQIQITQKIQEAKDRQSKNGIDETKTLSDLQSQSEQARLHAYGSMANAAKGFFKEGTTGYKLMEGAERAFSLLELANQAQKLYTRLTVTATTTAAEVAGQGVTTAAVVAGETAKNAAKVPGVYMAFMSQLGPWGMAAAGVAIAAVLGGAFSGGSGGGFDVKDRQAKQSTGSVLGSSDAKSESIANSLTVLEKNSGLGLAHSTTMIHYLKNVSDNIAGLASALLVRAGADITKGPADYVNGGTIGKISNSIFGGNKTTLDTGIATSKDSLRNTLAGSMNAVSYAQTKEDGGWFSSDKYRTSMTSLGAETNSQFTKIIQGMSDSIKEAAKELGVGGDSFNRHLETFVVDIGAISAKGLTGTEVQKALEAAFSKLGDDMAKFAITGLDKFQKVGEGYLETVMRVANDTIQVKDVFTVLGKTFNLTGISAANVVESLISAAGSLDTLTTGTKFFVDNFLTEAEKMGPITMSVGNQMTALGYGSVNTIEGFSKLVRSLDLTDPASQKLFASLMDIAPAFKDAADYATKLADGTVTLTKAQQKALDAVTKAKSQLQDSYNTESSALQGTIDKTKTFINTLKNYQDSLKLGADSPLTNMQKYAEARKQFDATAAAANGGDQAAKDKFTSASSALLAASKVVNASGDAYTSDFNMVQNAIDTLMGSSTTQVDVAQASLDALNASVAGLMDINKSVMSVTDAIKALQSAITLGGAAGLTNAQMETTYTPTPAQVAAATPSQSSGNGVSMAAPTLAAGIAAIGEHLAEFRKEAAAQTGALVGATVSSNEDNANTITGAMTSNNRNYKLAQIELA